MPLKTTKHILTLARKRLALISTLQKNDRHGSYTDYYSILEGLPVLSLRMAKHHISIIE